MEKIVVQGGDNRLVGSVTIEGAKNAVLPLLAATILASEGKTVLQNVPILSDVFTMNQVVRGLNAKVDFDEEGHVVEVDATGDITEEAPYKYVSKMRASIVVLGPILARVGHAKVSMPGGCTIGSRPIDLHLKGLEAMGAKISQTAGYIEAKAERLHGAHIYMDFPSVGATQNLMMAATLADGVTVIENAAREPEIVDLAIFLNEMGAKVKGAGTETITVTGVEELHGTTHNVVQDRIEAGTYISLAAAVGKGIRINNVLYEHLEGFIAKLEEMGVRMTVSEDSIFVEEQSDLKAINIKTAPYPGFATDLQQPITPLLLTAQGRGTIIDTIYEKRVNHVFELSKMDADITTTNDHILYTGGRSLRGANVKATDLRAGAALVIAGLMAEGKTEITNIEFILRGYSDIIEKLRSLGADITLVED